MTSTGTADARRDAPVIMTSIVIQRTEVMPQSSSRRRALVNRPSVRSSSTGATSSPTVHSSIRAALTSHRTDHPSGQRFFLAIETDWSSGPAASLSGPSHPPSAASRHSTHHTTCSTCATDRSEMTPALAPAPTAGSSCALHGSRT